MANGQTSSRTQIAGRTRIETYQLSSRTQANEQSPAEGIAWFRNTLEEQRRNLLAKISRSKEEAQTAEKMPADIAELWAEPASRDDTFAGADNSRRLLFWWKQPSYTSSKAHSETAANARNRLASQG